jgi:hypothetical protein
MIQTQVARPDIVLDVALVHLDQIGKQQVAARSNALGRKGTQNATRISVVTVSCGRKDITRVLLSATHDWELKYAIKRKEQC